MGNVRSFEAIILVGGVLGLAVVALVVYLAVRLAVRHGTPDARPRPDDGPPTPPAPPAPPQTPAG